MMAAASTPAALPRRPLTVQPQAAPPAVARRRAPPPLLVRGRDAAAAAAAPSSSAVVARAGKGGKGFAPKTKSGGGFGGGGNTSANKQQQQQQQLPDAGSPCPCGSGQAYGGCCRPAHAGAAPAPTPEALLRSRFAGYRLGLVDYLVATTHPAAPERRAAALGLPPPSSAAAAAAGGGGAAAAAEAYRASIARTARATEFVALAVDKAGADVRPRDGGGEGEQQAFLSFRVWHRPKGGGGGRRGAGGGESVALETSHFVRGADTGGRWLYLGEAQETGGEEGRRRAAEAEAAAEGQ